MNKYLYKIHQGFEGVEYHLDSVKELLGEDIDADNVSLVSHLHKINIKDFYYSLFGLELRLRALRDKLNELQT